MTKSQLQLLLDQLARAASRHTELRLKLSAYCEEKYGFDPADIDFDEFIDRCDGGDGCAPGMPVGDFIKGMEEGVKKFRNNR